MTSEPSPSAPHPAHDFTALFRRFHLPLVRHAARRFGARDADEIAQETFARALVSVDYTRSEREIWAWLVRVAHNVALDLARGRRRCESTDHDTVLADAPDEGLLPDAAALLDEHRRLVRRALHALTPAQRRVLVMYEVDGIGCPEIARIVGSSHGAVRRTLQRARVRLAAEVRALGGGTFGSLTFWLRRRSVKAGLPAAAASSALVAVVGSLAIGVGAAPLPRLPTAAPRQVTPFVAPDVRDPAPRAGTTASHVGRPAFGAPAERGEPRTDPRVGGGAHEVPFAPTVPVPNQLRPGESGSQRVVIPLPGGGEPIVIEREWENEEGKGVLCTLEEVHCDYEES